jgi:hypothetical protein
MWGRSIDERRDGLTFRAVCKAVCDLNVVSFLFDQVFD